MDRRKFINTSLSATAVALLVPPLRARASTTQSQAQPTIPRWRGFNLTELAGGSRDASFRESDFAWMADWGFDFARLPLSYWLWSAPHDWTRIDETALAPIDRAIAWARDYGVHINLNFHRIPGYCVNGREREPYQLFSGSEDDQRRALDAATLHWRSFAERYKEIPSSRLSFDLFNEPPFMEDQGRYEAIVRTLVAAIREISPHRLIVADGADIGQTPVPGIADLGLVQSTRGYLPKMVSHYTARWVPANEFESREKPVWPMRDASGVLWDKEKLRHELIEKWRPLTRLGVPVHVGEWGCFNRTPHETTLAWMSDLLALWKEAGWGWSMWNLRGDFGIVDSGRKDVSYENFHGHKLDRKMLELLLAN